MQKHILWLSALLLLVSPAARAETLDDASIKQIYAEATADIHNATKTREMMEKRLDNSFTLTSHMTRTIGNNPPQTGVETKNKEQAIRETIDGMSQMSIEDYSSNVTSIKYSADNKQAIVSDDSSSSGKVSLPNADGQYSDAKYDAKETCTDTLALVGSEIKIMKSDCTDQVSIQR